VTPLSNDPVTIPCPVCATPFVPEGKRRYCRDTCRVAAHRRRTRAETAPVVVPPPSPPRRPVTVYECDGCANKQLGEQYCHECRTFMRRIGYGGLSPCCGEPVTVDELLDQ